MCFGYGARGEQKMIPVHYMDGRDSPVGRCEVETVGDIDRAIIDAFEKRWVVNVDEDGGVACRTCDDDCGHEEKIRERLRSMTDRDTEADTDTDTDETAEERPVPTPNN